MRKRMKKIMKLFDETVEAEKNYEFRNAKHLDFYESYVDMHRGMLDRDVKNLGNIRILLAECYFKMGKAEKVDSLFKDWLTVEPEWGAGWKRAKISFRVRNTIFQFRKLLTILNY